MPVFLVGAEVDLSDRNAFRANLNYSRIQQCWCKLLKKQ